MVKISGRAGSSMSAFMMTDVEAAGKAGMRDSCKLCARRERSD